MKNIILIALLVTTFYNCKAQQYIIPLSSDQERKDNPDYYLKDTYNDFDNFIGTWKYENGNTSFKIVLEKRIKFQLSNDEYYEDLLVGRYQYIENGIEKANTLNNFPSNAYDYKILGNSIIYKTAPPVCDDCFLMERRIRLGVYHPTEEGTYGWLYLRYKNDNGVKKLTTIFKEASDFLGSTSPIPIYMDIPNGEYEMIKQ